MKARLLLTMGMLAVLAGRPAGAGPWSIEPRVGVENDYTSNPLLSDPSTGAEERIAAIFDLPLRYDTDQLEFLLRPNGRITDHQGYSSLASNYEHLDAAVQYTGALDTITTQGEIARDSSLYYIGGLINGIGVPRNSANVNADWTRSLTERSSAELDASWTRVRYDEPADFSQLLDYRYWSAGPTYSYSLSERNKVKLIGSYGRYQSLDGITESKSESLQLGFVRQLTEIWTVALSAGYSRSMNSQKVILFGLYYLGTQSSNQDSGTYAVTLTRQGERLNLNASVSRALQPTGFAYLSEQDSVNVGASYAMSERWDYVFNASWIKAATPQQIAGSTTPSTLNVDQRYLNVKIAANWHWTPQWILSLSVTEVSQQYGPPTVSAASTNVGLSIARQFLRTQF